MEIDLEQVDYLYSQNGQKVLEDIHLQFPAGKIIGIIGPIGSGKTTLLELMAGILFPTNGKISIGDFTISKHGIEGDSLQYHSMVGLVPQFPEESFSCDTVSKEIELALEKHHYNFGKRKEHLEKSLVMVGLDSDYLLRDPFSLSSAEMRKVSLACALSYNPKILLLDEIIVGLDSNDRKKLTTILTTIKSRYQKTVIIATHDIDFLNKIADEIVVLKNGKVLLSGDKKEVFKKKDIFEKEKISLPQITDFENYVLKEKNVSLLHREEVNDLVKDILRSLQ